MKRQYHQYTDKDIVIAVSKVTSMSALLKELGLRAAGGNFNNMKRKLQQLKIAPQHWTGQAWNRGQQLKDWSEYTKIESLKPHLFKNRGKRCEICRLNTWQNKPISLEVHHKDGNRTNNEFDNLQILCPNCHSATDNYRNKKVSAT